MPKPATPPAPPRIELRPLADLTPYARNPRTHSAGQVEQIARSLERFGWTNPVLIDGKGGIIAGHGRVAAAKLILERGGKVRDHADPATVPVIALARLTAAERKAYVLADNALALQSGWDEDLLALELKDLKALAFDLKLTGFDELRLDALTEGIAASNDPNEAWKGAPTFQHQDKTAFQQVVVIPDGPDEYGMRLVKVDAPPPRLRPGFVAASA